MVCFIYPLNFLTIFLYESDLRDVRQQQINAFSKKNKNINSLPTKILHFVILKLKTNCYCAGLL